MKNLKPPVAARIPHSLTVHGDTRDDPYYWLRERDNPAVIDYLNAENEYADHAMKHTEDLREAIFEELQSRVVESDMSAPVKDGQYEYYYRDRKSDSYLRHYRRKPAAAETEELLLNENLLAKDHSFFRLACYEVSPNDDLIAYATDTVGDERYTVEFAKLSDEGRLPDMLTNASGEVVWSKSGLRIYYTKLNDAHRPFQLYRHRLGDNPENDQLLYEESDEAFYMHISETDSGRFLCMGLAANSTDEVHLLDLADDQSTPQIVFPRAAQIEYCVQDRGERLYVLTNDKAVNFRLMRTDVSAPDNTDWEAVIDHSDEVTLTGFVVFRDFIAVSERYQGLPGVRIIQADGSQYHIEKPPEIQELRIGENREFNAQSCRLDANSLVLPHSQYDCELSSGKLTHIKTKPVGGEFRAENYAVEYHQAQSHDGVSIPVYLVSSIKSASSKHRPLLLYAYGSYGISLGLYFSSARLSLLDRGITCAFAHIRGGGEFGRNWYLDGKMLNKKNTFEDFNAAADYLIDQEITDAESLAIAGGSAGGLVVGNYVNSRPGGCRAALAYVPFVDIVTTMLDESLPLTVHEWDEWGNPNELQYYEYIKSYCPYDNVPEAAHPALYISAGLNDPRVGYWEPAKWAARVRHRKTDDHLLVLRTEMDSGHGGKSGRYDRLRETAIEYAFVIDQLPDGSLSEKSPEGACTPEQSNQSRVERTTIAGWYDSNADSLFRQFESVKFEQLHAELIEQLPRNPCFVLEIGAGSGRDAAALAKLGHYVTAVEPSDPLRTRAELSHRHANIQWMKDSLPKLNRVRRKGALYDVIFLSAVWMHVPPSQRKDTFRRITKMLKPGGLLYITLRHGPFEKMSGFWDIAANDVMTLARENGLLPVKDVVRKDDLLLRPGVSWSAVMLRSPGDGTGALPLLRHIVLNDVKSSTYKLGLLKVLAHIAQSASGLAEIKDDESVVIPLGLFALYWLKVYRPLLDNDMPQLPQNTHSTVGLGFVSKTSKAWQCLAEISPHNMRIGMSFSADLSRALNAVLKNISATLVKMPMNYITLPNSEERVFKAATRKQYHTPASITLNREYLNSFGEVAISTDLWHTVHHYGTWIEPAIVAQWQEIMKRYLDRQQRSGIGSDAMHEALRWDEQARGTEPSRTRAKELIESGDIKNCIWSHKPISVNNFDIDHCFPYSSWPCADMWNLMPAHRTVNQNDKREKLPTAELLIDSKDLIVEWWEKAYIEKPQVYEDEFFTQARASLRVESTDHDLESVFDALRDQQHNLRVHQQIPQWSPK